MFLNVDTTVIELRVLKIYRDAKRYPCNCFTTYKKHRVDTIRIRPFLYAERKFSHYIDKPQEINFCITNDQVTLLTIIQLFI